MDGSPKPSNFESLSRKLHEPLIPPLIAVISGILFARGLGFDPAVAMCCAVASGLLWIVARRKKLAGACFVAGNAIVFWLAVASAARTEQKPTPVIEAAPRELISLEGCVDSLPQREAERLFFNFSAAPDARLRVSLYLKPGEQAPDWAYGYRLQIPVRIKRIHNAGNPGNFNGERYFAHRDIYWSATIARGYPIVQAPNACGNVVQKSIFEVRSWLLSRIAQVTAGDVYLTAMLGALLLGDNARLEDSYTDNYRRTGTYHAIVISGIHITVLAGALYALLRMLQVRPMSAYVVCAIVAVLYALICDLSAPVVRAAGGYLLFLGAKYFYRRGRALNLLAAVAVAYLLVDPGQLLEASFQLSFLSVLTLATLGDPLIQVTTRDWAMALRRLEDPQADSSDPRVGSRRLELQLAVHTISRVLRISATPLARICSLGLGAVCWALDLFLTSGVVLVGLCLPMILFFHRLTFSSLTANLPVVFLLSLAVPIGFLAILTGPTLVPLLKWLLYTSRDVVDWHLTWDPATRIPDPPLWIMLALPMTLLATAWIARKHPRFSGIPILMVLSLFVYVVSHPYAQSPALSENLLELTAIDVGQGDALFVATPGHHLALLDGGGNRSSKFDPGESTVSPYLWSRQIAKLHTLIASHGDLDHMGGLLAAHDNFHPEELWVSSQVSGPLWDRLKIKATRRGTRIRYLAKGDRVKLGELDVITLWPPRDEPIEKSNLKSLVLLLIHGQKRFLLTGDIDQSVEARLVEDPVLPRLDFLKIAHHGSRTSTSESFLEKTRPAIAVASSGFENSFNHPHPAVLARLEEFHTAFFRTDRMGQISVYSDGKKLMVDPYAYRSRSGIHWTPFTQALE